MQNSFGGLSPPTESYVLVPVLAKIGVPLFASPEEPCVGFPESVVEEDSSFCCLSKRSAKDAVALFVILSRSVWNVFGSVA